MAGCAPVEIRIGCTAFAVRPEDLALRAALAAPKEDEDPPTADMHTMLKRYMRRRYPSMSDLFGTRSLQEMLVERGLCKAKFTINTTNRKGRI